MDGEVFYYAGGVLVLAALVISAIGIRNHEQFPPSRTVMAAVIGVFAVLVIAATGTAVVLAREEQDHRRHELAEEELHAAEEAEAEEPPPGRNLSHRRPARPKRTWERRPEAGRRPSSP